MAEGFGELGGAGDIVERALWACARMREASGPETALADAFCSALGAPDLDSLFEGIKREGWVVGAELAPLVLEVAARGDEVTQRLLEEQGRSLADEVLGVARRLGMVDDGVRARDRRQRASRRVGAPRHGVRGPRGRGRAACADHPAARERRCRRGQARARSDRRDAVSSHMRREIAQQPAAVAATLAEVAAPAAALAAAVRARGLDRVVLVARGTSDHVAIYARYLLEARCALSASLAAPSLYTTYRPPVDLSRALVLGVSQSGQTPEIVAALEFAAGRGALTAALTNEAGSPLASAAGHALVTAAGERAVGRGHEDVHDGPGRDRGARARTRGERPGGRPRGAPRTRSARPRRCPTSSSSRPLARCSRPRRPSASPAATPMRRRSRRHSSSRRSPGCGPRASARPTCATARARPLWACRRSSSTRAARSPAMSTDWSASLRLPARPSSRSDPVVRCRPPRGCARSSPRSR